MMDDPRDLILELTLDAPRAARSGYDDDGSSARSEL